MGAAVYAPQTVGVILLAFSLLVFLLAVVGLLRPELARLPNRAASVWVWALSFGLLVAGSTLMAPPEDVVRSDTRRRTASLTRDQGLVFREARERDAAVDYAVRAGGAMRTLRICLETGGRYVVETETETDDAAAIAFLTREDGTKDGAYVASVSRLRRGSVESLSANDPLIVQSDPIELAAGEPCYTLSAQTGVSGKTARARLLRATP